MTSDAIAQLVEQLRRCQHLVVLTGAGVSAESGVPTFRDAQTGLWANYRSEDLATPEAFERDPALVWRWYESRRVKLSTVKPNPGHHALVELERKLPRLTLITQNVDGLHQEAGSTGVIEFHGNIHRTVCSSKPCPGEWQAGDDAEPPMCTQCGSLLRPDVVWFGEGIPEAAMADSLDALQTCDLFISAGTSAQVYPAAGLAAIAADNNAVIAEINPQSTPLSSAADMCITKPSGKALPEMLACLPQV